MSSRSHLDPTAHLVKDDEQSRPYRAERIRELLQHLEVPDEGILFHGGELSVRAFDEMRLCFVARLHLATVLTALMFIEHELAAMLFARGDNSAARANLKSILQQAEAARLITVDDHDRFKKLRETRNSYAHFREPLSQTSVVKRALDADTDAFGITQSDALNAIGSVALFLKNRPLL